MKAIAGIAVLYISAACVLAADQPDVVTVSRAFSPFVQPGRWGQVTARLRNPTDRAVRLRFIYFAEDPTRGRVRYTRTVELPSRTHRALRLGQRIGPVKRKRSSAKKVTFTEQAFRLEDADTNKILDSDYILVSATSPTQCCLAYVDPEDLPGQDHSYLGHIPNDPFGNVVLISSRQQHLPDRWYGHSLLKILFISSAESAKLSDSQISAVLDWVGHGGALVITAHSSADRTFTGRLGEAAGVIVAGTHQEYRLEATCADGKARFQTDLKTPMVMTHLCPTDADVLWQANGMPLLARHRMGAGVVFTLAVPVGALATNESQPLWQTMARQMERLSPISTNAFAAAAEGKLTQIAGRRSPDRRAPAYIIGAQVGLFLLLGLFLQLRRRGELGWVVMIPLGLAGAAGLLVWGMTLRDEPRLSFLALASARPDGTAHVQQLSTYYTPHTEQIDLSSGSPLGTIRPVASASTSAMESMEIGNGRTMNLAGVRIISNSWRTALTEAPVNLPGRLVAKVQLGPKGLEGTITNNTGSDIFDAVLITGSAAYAVGPLPDGRTTNIVVHDPPLPKDTYTGKTVRSDKDLLRNDLIAAVVRPPVAARRFLTEQTPMLLGWTRRPLLDPLGKKDVESNGWTLLTMPLTLMKSPPGTKVVVPGGLLKLHIGGHPPVWVPKERRFNESTLPGEVELNFAPPDSADKLTAARAVMRISLRATNCRMRVFGFVGAEGKGPEKTLIDTIDRPVGKYTIIVDALKPVAGGYKITIRIDPVVTGKPDSRERITTLWKIESLNLTLEGMIKEKRE